MNLSFHVLAHDLKTTTGGSQSTEPEAIPWRLGICRVIAPFQAVQGLFSSPLISVSAHPCPRAAGRERWAGVTETLSPIQRRRPQGKEGQKIYTVSTSPLYVEIYSLTQPKADLELKTPQFFYRTVRCFQSRLIYLEGIPEWAAGNSLNSSLQGFMIVAVILRRRCVNILQIWQGPAIVNTSKLPQLHRYRTW